MRGAFAAAVALLSCCGASAIASAEERNPFEGNEVAIGIGRTLFANRCADCHGPDAKGKLGPDLTQRWARGASDESAFAILRNGVPGSSMPPSAAPDNELWAIVAHLRNISVMPPLVSTGDVERGRALFAKECSSCHQVRGEGGALGPDLTSIGATRSRVSLMTSLREPSASVALGFRTVTAVTRARERIEGVVKGEDAFSVQIMTGNGELKAYPKSELAELARSAESLMPAYDAGTLSAAALEDLLAYMGTLRGAEEIR
jgi:cytochrome c oxidase cbb3-type subunit III